MNLVLREVLRTQSNVQNVILIGQGVLSWQVLEKQPPPFETSIALTTVPNATALAFDNAACNKGECCL